MLFLKRALAGLFLLPLLATGCTATVTGGEGGGGGGGGEDCEGPAPGDWCGGYSCVDGKWEPNPTFAPCGPACPEAKPAEGSNCAEDGQTCSYPGEVFDCGPSEPGEVELRCVGGAWTTMAKRCQPPLECPDELPVAGTDCSGWDMAYHCAYSAESGCGPTHAVAACDGSVWSVEATQSCEDCSDLGDPASCSASPACRWLVPGCGEAPLGEAGCYPKEDCTETSCGEGEACSKVTHDPCWNSSCEACGADAMICEPALPAG